MGWLHFVVRFFPFWALPSVGLCVQLAIHYRRRGTKGQWFWVGLGAWLVLMNVLWVYFRGDIHGDAWVRSFINE